MENYKNSKRMLCLVVAMLMIIGSFSSFAYAEKSLFDSFKEDLYEEASKKIEMSVIEDLNSQDLVEVMVYMKEQVDTDYVVKTTSQSLSKLLTPYEVEMEIKKSVLNSLKDKSETSQSRLLNYLEGEKEKGNVEEFTSYHIVNMVYLRARRNVIDQISYMGEVERIYKNETHTMDLSIREEPIQLDDTSLNSIDPKWNITRIGADKAWDMDFNGTGAVVGIIDSGVDWTHPALKNQWRGYNPITDTTDPSKSWFDPIQGQNLPVDSDQHGTHVIGSVLGVEEDGSNPIGVAPGAKWIAARVFSSSGQTTDSILISAAEWMLAPGGDPSAAPDVVNNSWGGGQGLNNWYLDLVKAWRASGIFPVFSAGNQMAGEPEPWPGSISVPSNYIESFAVAAVDNNDIRGSFSKLGPSPYDPKAIKPNISAPGVNIYSSIPGGGYGLNTGTSMAAPHVSGVVALLRSVDASLSVDEIEDILSDTADQLVDSSYPISPNFAYGYGMVNAYDSIALIADGTGYVSGRVLVSGQDISSPEIDHQQEVFMGYQGADIEIRANIEDDISITEAEVLVKLDKGSYWTVIPMNRISGDYKKGEYLGIVPQSLLKGDKLAYKIRVRDFIGNVVTTPTYNIDIIFGVLPGEYEEGFEEFPMGWIFDGDWQWGKSKSIDPAPYEGEGLAGTILGSKYNPSKESYMITPPIDLRDKSLTTASLRFHHWYETENNYDKGHILITNDYGENWHQVGPTYMGNGKEWTEIYIPLDDYIGSETAVYVAYVFTANASSQFTGWYVDNVRLMGKDNLAPTKPTNLKAEAGIEGINLSWTPSPDIDLYGYNIYRSQESGKDYIKIGQTTNNYYLDKNVESGTTYYYLIESLDFSGNRSEKTSEVWATAADVIALLVTDFEENNGGFIAGGSNNSWEWGLPNSGPGKAFSGQRLWATNLQGDYYNSSDSYIESESIVVPDGMTPVLTFNHWHEFEGVATPWDYGMAMVSNDGGENWDNVTPIGRYGGSSQFWKNETIWLDDYKGDTIKIRFFFHSDNAYAFSGWYIDDVSLIAVGNSLSSLKEESNQTKIDKRFKENYNFNYNINKIEATDNYSTITDNEAEEANSSIGQVPASGAIVTILETGKSVRVDPATGRFSIRTPIGDYKLKIEAYGYFDELIDIVVEEEKHVKLDVLLKEKPRGTIQGRVVDRYWDNPASYATIRIVEDTRIMPVTADEEGYFTIPQVLIGEYTLRVVAKGFYLEEFADIEVREDDTTELELKLKGFVGYEDEISYDDGNMVNALVLKGPPNGLAVRFTPEQFGQLKGARVSIMDESWPTPGGNRIGFMVYSTDEYGTLYEVGDPIFLDVKRGEWNHIDLSSFGFSTDKDFYISTIQAVSGDQSPGLGIDDSGPSERSYMNVNGMLTLMSDEGIPGSLMIRALVDYSIETPRITNLDQLNYTNKDKVVVKGKLDSDCQVNIYVNDQIAKTVSSKSLEFEAEVDLPLDDNTIMVTAEIDNRQTEPSRPVRVIKDKLSPLLLVESPEDNSKVNKGVIRVKGQVSDNIEVSKLLINEEEIILDQSGDFNERIFLEPGENMITIQAFDPAGNITTIERKVTMGKEAGKIDQMTPAEDQVYGQGSTIEVSFRSEAGGQGFFRILAGPSLAARIDTRIPMEEVEPGYYKGRFIVPEGYALRDGLLEFEFIDQYGNRSLGLGEARVTILGISMDQLPNNTIILGNRAYDARLFDKDRRLETELKNWKGPVYIKLDQTTLVDVEGVLVDEAQVLPDLINYFGQRGLMVYEKLD